MPKTKSVLVTGGAGFIGSHVADAYLERGWSVTIIDDLSSGSRENVPEGAELIELDVRDEGLQGVFERRGGFQLVNHHAAQIDVRMSVSDPKLDAEVNIGGLLNVLEAARLYGTERILYVSSGGVVYGDSRERPISETAAKRPESPYGVSKLVGEHYLRCYRLLHGIDYFALRYSNVYGPRQEPHGEAGVVAIFCSRLLRNAPLTIYGDGGQTRDYVFVEDVARANLAATRGALPAFEDLDDVAFNVGTGVETSVNELARTLLDITDSDLEVHHAAPRAGDLFRSAIDPSKLAATWDWKPQTGLADGLKRTYDWIAADQ